MARLKGVSEYLDLTYPKEIRARHVLPAAAGDVGDYPKGLHPKLAEVLRGQGIDSLYSHQVEAFEPISRQQDTVLVSHTASGKTLSFLLPILNEYMGVSAPFSVLLLYPTKALSRDQEGALGKLIQTAGIQVGMGTFDGDTPREERARLSRQSDFIITNPDMLHSGLLPNHNRKWKGFLSRLRYIVIDEVHTYRGSFGSHVANVFRRLLRACEIHGSRPTFVCSSATVGNPREHVEALFQRDFTIIDSDGAPRPQRHLYMVNPPLVQSQGHALYRKGPGSVSIPLIRFAAKQKVRTICFCRARQEVERLYRAVLDHHPELRDVVKPYRGGLLPNERRKLERDLAAGRLNTIITTNALELGIDIGGLDLCILSGHPGTFASFWQQAGRVGRQGQDAVIVYIAKDAPIDQYLVHHPEFITSAPIERAWLSAENPYIMLQHLPCAAYEHPLRVDEPLYSGPAYPQAVEVLRQDKTLKPYRQYLRYALTDYPARGVNLRGMTDYNVEIVCGTEVIGELDPIGARGTLYKDAIYQHLGRRYMSLDLDLEKKICQVGEVDVDYYTEAVWENRITMTDVEESKEQQESPVAFGYINVNKQPKLYKKIRERSFENVGYGPITLPAFEYDTTGFSLLPAAAWQEAMKAKDKRYIDAALYGLSYLMKRVAPSVCMGDIQNIETDVALLEVDEGLWQSALYLFDTVEGGVGYAEKIYELLPTVLGLCRQIIRECECEAGCPSCVPPLPPGVDNEDLALLFVESNAAVTCSLSLLAWLLDGEQIVPDVVIVKKPLQDAVEKRQPDIEAIKLNNRLQKASELLRKKRERLH
ncbi:DEAD/DEAH box helicase [Planctomycetota bacterium]